MLRQLYQRVPEIDQLIQTLAKQIIGLRCQRFGAHAGIENLQGNASILMNTCKFMGEKWHVLPFKSLAYELFRGD